MAAQSVFYSDLSYTPKVNNLGDISSVINADAIKQSIMTIIFTSKGSRIFEPDFGCGIEGYLFEPLDNITAQKIVNEIERSLTSYEPRIILRDLVIKTIDASSTYDIEIMYLIKDIQQIDNLNVKLVKI